MVLLALAALAAGLLISPAAEGRARKAPCAKAKSKTLAQTRTVRVYEVDRGDDGTLYGCRKSTGRSIKLDTRSDDGFTTSDTYDRVQIFDNQVSWVSTVTERSCKADCPPGVGTPKVRIAVRNLKTRAFRSVPAAPLGDAVVLSTNGGVAWAAQGAAPGVVDIHASARGEEDRVIDSGNIDAKTLRIEITIISWTRDGAERFVRLR